MALQVGNNFIPVGHRATRVTPANNAQANQAPAQAATPAVTTTNADAPMTPEEINKGIGVFFKGLGIGLLVFCVVVAGLWFFPMNFVLRAFLVLLITILLFYALDYSMGKKKSNYTGSVIAVIVIGTIVLLLIYAGKNKGVDKTPPQNASAFKSEILTFNGAERHTAHIALFAGQSYRVTVENAPVNITHDGKNQLLTPEHGPYMFEVYEGGYPTFDGIANSKGIASVVKIEWKE